MWISNYNGITKNTEENFFVHYKHRILQILVMCLVYNVSGMAKKPKLALMKLCDFI